MDRVKLSMMVFGSNQVDYYKSNTMFMLDKYSKSEDNCKSISPIDIQVGRFYHLQYLDDSNWMKYSPIFCIDYKKLNQMTVVIGINFNFIPLEIRSAIFDKYIIEKDFEDDRPLKVDFKGAYMELLRYGFEYSIVEYNLSQIKIVHSIGLDILPRFLYSSYPKNKYDPNKLMEIWTTKIKTREKRHQEITLSVLSDFYKIGDEIDQKYEVLSGHIDRLRKSFEKFGNK